MKGILINGMVGFLKAYLFIVLLPFSIFGFFTDD